MPKILDIHQYIYKKYESTFKHMISPLTDKLQIKGLSYARAYPNGKVIAQPILKSVFHEAWIETDYRKEPSFAYTNLIKLPKLICYHDLSEFLSNEDTEYSGIKETKAKGLYGLFYLKHNADGSITRLALHSTIPVNKLQGVYYSKTIEFDSCINMLDQYLFDEKQRHLDFDITKDIDPIQLQTSYNIDTTALTLTKSEAKCFKQLYTGTYEASQIAKNLSRSPRTIEHTIANLCYKLQCDSKMKLVVKISHMHDAMCYFLQKYGCYL